MSCADGDFPQNANSSFREDSLVGLWQGQKVFNPALSITTVPKLQLLFAYLKNMDINCIHTTNTISSLLSQMPPVSIGGRDLLLAGKTMCLHKLVHLAQVFYSGLSFFRLPITPKSGWLTLAGGLHTEVVHSSIWVAVALDIWHQAGG